LISTRFIFSNAKPPMPPLKQSQRAAPNLHMIAAASLAPATLIALNSGNGGDSGNGYGPGRGLTRHRKRPRPDKKIADR